MTTTYCDELSGIASFPQTQAQGYYQGGHVVVFQSTVQNASQLAGSIIVLAQPSAGLVYLGARVTVSATLGSTTLAISDSVSGNVYVVAAAFTASAVVPPTSAQLAYGPLTSQANLIATTAAATLPSSGSFCIHTYWMQAT